MVEKLKEIFAEYKPSGSTDIEKLSNLINIWRREGHLTVEEAHREEQLDTILKSIAELGKASLVKVPTDEEIEKVLKEWFKNELVSNGCIDDLKLILSLPNTVESKA